MEDSESKSGNKKPTKSSKKLTYLLIGLVVLQVIVLAATMLTLKGRGSGGRDSGSSSFPFWLVIFIPIIAAKRKKKASEEEENKRLWMMVGLAVLVLLGMAIFLFHALGYY